MKRLVLLSLIWMSFSCIILSCGEDDIYVPEQHDIDVPKQQDTSPPLLVKFYMAQNSNSGFLQGSAAWNGVHFQFTDRNSTVFINDLNNKSFVQEVNLSGKNTNHCNNASFSNILYDPNDMFPLIYVSGSKDGTYNHVQVYRIKKDSENNFSIIQVQEITLPKGTYDNEWHWTQVAIDNTNNYLYVYSSNKEEHIYKFNIPNIHDENISLTEADVLEEFSLSPLYHPQGMTIKDDKLFILFGAGGGDINYLQVINLNNKTVEEVFNLSKMGFANYEFEGISVYNNELIIASNFNKGLYSVSICN